MPSKYQFEDDMSGEEDAVLDSADTHETMASSFTNIWPVTPLSVTDENVQESTVDLTISSHNEQQQESESMSNVNSDSNSASLFSDSSVQSSAQSISHKKTRKYEKVKLNEAIMAKAPVKIVDEIPWDINGHIIYKIKCTEKTYYDKYEDGRWFTLKNSHQNGLNGNRSTRRCQGSYIYHYPDCSKCSCEDIVNTIDFKREGEGIKTCSSCGRMVRQTYCGAIKVIEFNKDTNYLTYWHQGFHICTLKPNVKFRRCSIDCMPLLLTAASTPQKYMKDCMLHYINEDDYDTAFEVPKALSEQDVIAQIKKKRKYPNCLIHKQDEIDSFINVNQIQESLLKSDKDRFLVYKWECKAMGHKVSYVFKTSKISLCVAAMMAGKIKIDTLTHEPVYFDGMHSHVKYFFSLTLWAFHPAMRLMLMLAVMDTPTKTADDIEIFFDTFNKALADYLEEPEYIMGSISYNDGS